MRLVDADKLLEELSLCGIKSEDDSVVKCIKESATISLWDAIGAKIADKLSDKIYNSPVRDDVANEDDYQLGLFDAYNIVVSTFIGGGQE